MQGSLPISINLIKCTTEQLQVQIDNSKIINSIPNWTIKIECFNTDLSGPLTTKDRIITNYLSFNNEQESSVWLRQLNRILKFIKDWNL